MKRFIKRLKHNNKGMSLVEILVTIAIISIIATPLINSFITAMNANAEARRIQNGTSVAQDLAELFKVFELEDILSKDADGNYTFAGIASGGANMDDVEVSIDEDTGKYTFSGIAMEGANGEDFVVDVTLNPAIYSDGTDKFQVNNMEIPSFSGLYNSSMVIQKEYTKYDDQLQELFHGTDLPQEIVQHIYEPEYRKNISKSTDIHVKCTYQAENDAYNYEVSMNTTYYYQYGATKIPAPTPGIEATPQLFEANEIQSIYMICPVFDKFTSDTILTTADGTVVSYATDTLNITYEYSGAETKQQHVYFYIAEQEAKNINDNGKIQKIDPLNVYIDYKTSNKTYENYYSELVSAMENNDTTYKFRVLTNIGDSDTAHALSGELHDLTKGDNETGTALYQMDVTVKLKKTGETIATFSTTR